jgi:hypothetical protein
LNQNIQDKNNKSKHKEMKIIINSEYQKIIFMFQFEEINKLIEES